MEVGYTRWTFFEIPRSSIKHILSSLWFNFRRRTVSLEMSAEKIVPRVKADEEEEEEEPELVDPAVEIKAHCAEDHCAKYKAR